MNYSNYVFVLGNHVQACCWHVQRLPRPGETYQAHDLTVEPGGKGLNVGVGLQRLGIEVFMLLGCGQDAAADALLTSLEQEGLDTEGVIHFPGASGWGAGLIGADGQTAIAVYPGANLLLRAEHVRPHATRIANADLVYGQFETAIQAVVEAFDIAHTHGVTTVLNPSPWQTPPCALLCTTQVLFVNETEAALLLGLAEPSSGWAGLRNWSDAYAWLKTAVSQVWAQWTDLRCLVVTFGEMGASIWLRPTMGQSPGDVLFMPAATVEVQDPIGAGDAFACGFIVQWLVQQNDKTLRSWDDKALLASCLSSAQSLGAHMAATRGVLAGLPAQPVFDALKSNILPGPALWHTA